MFCYVLKKVIVFFRLLQHYLSRDILNEVLILMYINLFHVIVSTTVGHPEAKAVLAPEMSNFCSRPVLLLKKMSSHMISW